MPAEADPEVVAHLRKCDSCLLDWQIQLGARYLSDPGIDATASVDPDERIIARATAIMRHSERRPGWRHLVLAGLLAPWRHSRSCGHRRAEVSRPLSPVRRCTRWRGLSRPCAICDGSTGRKALDSDIKVPAPKRPP